MLYEYRTSEKNEKISYLFLTILVFCRISNFTILDSGNIKNGAANLQAVNIFPTLWSQRNFKLKKKRNKMEAPKFCKHNQQGYCKWGEKCRKEHVNTCHGKDAGLDVTMNTV